MPSQLYNVVQLADPVMDTLEPLPNNRSIELKLDFEPVIPNSHISRFSLRIPRPTHNDSFRIRHGYTFQLRNHLAMTYQSPITAEVFSWLIQKTIAKINESSIGGKIILGDDNIQTLVKAVLSQGTIY